jgi:hypothetical protein
MRRGRRQPGHTRLTNPPDAARLYSAGVRAILKVSTMSYSSPSSPAAPARKRNVVPWVAGGCAVLGLCVLGAAVAGGGYYFYSQRPVTAASAPSVEYILDATQRMAQMANGENDTRLNVARGVLAEIVRPSDPTVTAGLRVFGSGAQAAPCSDTTLLVPLTPASQTQISTHLLSITSGASPDAAMSQAMVSAIRDLAKLKGKHTLVVVTGGADSCSPQAGELIAAEAQKAGIDLKLFMIGYQVPASDIGALQGVVDGSGGNYVNADNKVQLSEVLTSIQQYVQDQNAKTVSNVMGTAAAAVGTQNVIVAGTPAATSVAGSTSTPAAANTGAPASTPGITATPGGTAAVLTGQTLCDNPYFPLRTGATWNYSSDNGPVSWMVSGVTGDQSEAIAAMKFTSGGASGTYNWHCTAAGLESYDFAAGSAASSGGTIQVTQHSGSWLPQVDKLVPGATWDSSYTLVANYASANVTETFSDHYTLVGVEPHDVAGKTMDALHIETTGTVDIAGVPTGGGTFPTSATYYLVRGIGLVSFTNVFAGTSSSSSLTSYSVP